MANIKLARGFSLFARSVVTASCPAAMPAALMGARSMVKKAKAAEEKAPKKEKAKKASSPWNNFMKLHWEKTQKDAGGKHTAVFAEASKSASAQWKSMSEAEKEKFKS